MKRKQPHALCTALGLLAGTVVWATPVMADCTLVLSQPEIDFGTLNRDSLVIDGNLVKLGERSLGLTLSCDTDSDMTLLYRGAALDAERFQFGDKGQYRLRLRDAMLDGRPTTLGELGPAGETPAREESTLAWRPDRGLVPFSAGSVVKGKLLQAQMDIVAQVPRDALRVRDETQWVASATIEAAAGIAGRGLSLKSTLLPVACTPVLSGDGQVDFGRRTASEFNRSAPTTLAAMSVQLNITCDGDARFALRTLDNRNGTALRAGESNFGLGQSGGAPIGHYNLVLDNINVEGWTGAYITRSGDGGDTWSVPRSSSGELLKDALLGFGTGSGVTRGPADLRQMSATLSVTPTIAPLNTLDMSKAVVLDGSATIELIYQ